MQGFNRVRPVVWKQQPDGFFDEAIIEADGTMMETTGERKEGIGIIPTSVATAGSSFCALAAKNPYLTSSETQTWDAASVAKRTSIRSISPSPQKTSTLGKP
jgi:hypothetical protein